ncbi:MAG: 3-deoxy-D-manno-octulosonic acid transferase [Gemmatimonadota bacterium]
MDPLALSYRLGVALVRAGALLAPGRGGKVARGLRGRRGSDRRLAAWGGAERDPARPGWWLHAPSVGEGLQARAVAEALAWRVPDLQTVFTHFSPSAEVLAREFPADTADYLPWDLKGPSARVLDAIRPGILAFTKTEVWPVLATEARRRGIPVVLTAARLPASAGRRRAPARRLLRSTWESMALVAAASEEDAEGFVELGVPPSAVTVTGDPGVDAAAHRVGAWEAAAPWLVPLQASGRPIVVAGSTWPVDEALLLSTVVRARGDVPDLCLVVAPHEPTPAAVAHLLSRARRAGLTAATLGRVVAEAQAPRGTAAAAAEGAELPDVVVVERVGILARLYTAARVAYVGGGFHAAGLHSVLEPAAAGIPVLFGPGRDAHARGLEAAGGGVCVPTGNELAREVVRFLREEDVRRHAGTRAIHYIDAHRGAADRTAALLAAKLAP